MSDEIRILTPTPMLGYGFPVKWFRKGLDLNPHAITADAGSTDSGPHKLGTGAMTCSREAYRKDISLLLEAGHEKKVPVFISSAGGDGTNSHVDEFLEIIRSICRDKGYHFKTAAIYADIDKDYIKKKMREGKVGPCGPVKALTEEEIDQATSIVAQMGIEPYLEVLKHAPDVELIVSGRTYDPVPIAVLGIRDGYEPGLSWHMGKIMECGALCAEPSGKSIFGTLRRDHFDIEPLDPVQKCTTVSVAAHTLYEKTHPYLLSGPGGVTDLSDTRFTQLDERRVRVFGSKFSPSKGYAVKLEGAKKLGSRSIFIAGVRDPIEIEHIDEVLAHVRCEVEDYFADIPRDRYRMVFHVYGKNGVMGEFEREKDFKPLEVCVIAEVAAPTQEMATAICSRARTEMLHCPYPGRIATAGNVGFPFTPLEIPLGTVCEFNVYHLMEIEDPAEPFRIQYLEV